MSQRIDELTPRLLRDWRLPDPRGSKYDRGSVDELTAVMVELDS